MWYTCSTVQFHWNVHPSDPKSDKVRSEEIASPLKLVVDKNKIKNVNADEVNKAIKKRNKEKQLRRKRLLLNSDWGKNRNTL